MNTYATAKHTKTRHINPTTDQKYTWTYLRDTEQQLRKQEEEVPIKGKKSNHFFLVLGWTELNSSNNKHLHAYTMRDREGGREKHSGKAIDRVNVLIAFTTY